MKEKQNFTKIASYVILAFLGLVFVAKYVFGLNFDFFPNEKNTDSMLAEGDTFNICKNEPYRPVCGSDAKTYDNACLAKLQWITIFATGVCDKNISQTGSASATETKTCTTENDPVCGKNGVTYRNSCLASVAGVPVVSYGECKAAKIDEDSHSGATNPSQSMTGANTQSGSVISATGSAVQTSTGYIQNTPNATIDLSKTVTYSSKLGYSFAMPNSSYYSSFWSVAGATHTMAVSTTDAGIANFENADIKVYFYKTEPANPPTGTKIKTTNWFVYVSNAHPENAKMQKIYDTILATVQ